MHHGSLRGFRVWLGAAALVVGVPVTSGAQVPDGEWHAFGRDPANSKYSPLDQGELHRSRDRVELGLAVAGRRG